MLYLIGLGIGDESDISLKGLEACRKADEVYCELYTAKWQGSLRNLGKMINKEIIILERKNIEEESREFVKKAKNRDIALLVPGDPLTATTHVNLVMEAKGGRVPFRIIHSSSILTAVAETGLSLYNFGKTATVVRPGKGYAPTSFYDAGALNRKQGMHTLFLLDVDMDTGEGLRILLDIEKKKESKFIPIEDKIIAASMLGSDKNIIKYDRVKTLLKEPLKPPAVLIVPGRLHFLEKEFLESL